MKGIKCTSNDVNAILAGDKSQIRLVIKPQPYGTHAPSFQKYSDIFCFEDKFGGIRTIKAPHQIGDLVFVKETFEEWDDGLVYKADNSLANKVSKWKPAQHMKQHQSRITLRIKDISVERLQDISREDCLKEGKDQWEFICDWNATHKKPEEKWEANPWVWKIEFEVVK